MTKLERRSFLKTMALGLGSMALPEAFASALGEAGAKVAIADLRAEAAEQVSKELEQQHVETLSITANVADPQSVEAMVAKVINHFGALHIAFNNAVDRHCVTLDAALHSKVTPKCR